MARHALSPEENALSYSKYWYWRQLPLNPLSQELLREPMDPSDILKFEDLNDLFKPGYLARENGWCMLRDGSGYMSVYMWMPNVTIDMIDWWFVWHFCAPASVPKEQGNLRYKIWCPQEHVDTGFDDEASRARALDESIPIRQRRYGQRNFIKESVDGGDGDNILFMHATCHDPVEFGFDPVKLSMPENGSVVASKAPDRVCVYHYRPYGNGIEMRVRGYLGMELENGEFRRKAGVEVVPGMLVGSCQHMLVEYPNLARFLPSLYAEESVKPIDAY